MINDISFWVLLGSLFFPRLTLFIAWLTGNVPLNSIPFLGDVIMTIFIPRILMLIYIGLNLGVSNPWFIVHLIFCVFIYLGSMINGLKNASS